MIAYLQGITRQRSSWTLLLVSALFLEICAMVFQPGRTHECLVFERYG